jgi:beta-glucanase (GH16 family)
MRLILIMVTATVSAGALAEAHSVGFGERRDVASATPRATGALCCHTPAPSNAVGASLPHKTTASPRATGHPTPTPPSPQVTGSSRSSRSSAGATPPGNVRGWRLAYHTDFSGNSLPAGWGAYSGEPGSDPYGYWDPADVTVGNGELQLRTKADDDPQQPGASSTGGISFYGNPQTYGMYLVRMKGDYEPGLQISDIALLWPAGNNVWPPEIDFYEDEGGARSGFTASLHPGPDGDDCCIIRRSTSNSGTQWHTYGLIWTPTSITYTIDGKVWGEVESSQLSSPAQWPDVPMNLDLQSQNLGAAQPNGSITTLTVAWVAEYVPSSLPQQTTVPIAMRMTVFRRFFPPPRRSYYYDPSWPGCRRLLTEHLSAGARNGERAEQGPPAP